MQTKSMKQDLIEARNAVIYARVSSEGDRQDTARQVSNCTTFCGRHGYTILKVFEEHISGAKSKKERPVLTQCVTHLESVKDCTLVVDEMSRLGRSVLDVLNTVDELKKKNINIEFIKEGFALFNDNGEINPLSTVMIAVLGSCAEMERQTIYYRMKSGLELYRANGGKTGRKKGMRFKDEFYREKYADLIQKLEERKNHRDCGCKRDKSDSIRAIADQFGVTTQTVQVIKKKFNL